MYKHNYNYQVLFLYEYEVYLEYMLFYILFYWFELVFV